MRPLIFFAGLSLAMSCVGNAGRLAEVEDASSGGVSAVEIRPPDDAGFVASDASVFDFDAGVFDAGVFDAGVFDASVFDAGVNRVFDAGALDQDASVPPDAGAVEPDAGAPIRDAGVRPVDAGLDAGRAVVDAGTQGTGRVDAGIPDAGQAASPPDAGPCVPLQGTVTTLAKGTYCVTGDVIIPTGVTLDIPAGTTFIVMGRYHFGRDPAIPDAEPPAIPGSGTLHAIGTAAEPIVFRGQTPNTGWYGIVVSHSHDSVHLEYVTIRDTYKNDTNPSSRIWKRGGALGSYVNVHGTIIRHCTFINNRASSVAGALDINSHGSWPNAGPVEITDTLFQDNYCECLTYSGSSIDLCGGGAIRFSHVGGDANLVKIRNNTFQNNEARRAAMIDAFGGAIGGFDDGFIIGPGNVFDSNHATGDGAISCSHEPRLGTIIDAVDPSVVFINNTPDNGCGL